MAKVITGNPETLEKISGLERDFNVKVSYKLGSDTAYLINGKNTNNFLNAILGIEGIEEIQNSY